MCGGCGCVQGAVQGSEGPGSEGNVLVLEKGLPPVVWLQIWGGCDAWVGWWALGACVHAQGMTRESLYARIGLALYTCMFAADSGKQHTAMASTDSNMTNLPHSTGLLNPPKHLVPTALLLLTGLQQAKLDAPNSALVGGQLHISKQQPCLL